MRDSLFNMIPSQERRKKKFFKEMEQTHSEEMQDKLEPILCPMHEDYDDENDNV